MLPGWWLQRQVIRVCLLLPVRMPPAPVLGVLRRGVGSPDASKAVICALARHMLRYIVPKIWRCGILCHEVCPLHVNVRPLRVQNEHLEKS